MYPDERSLVSRMQGKPFALLGINTDKDRNELKKVLAQEKITWRSWWNGGGTEGPITREWGISSYPAIFVLDQKGVIRFKNNLPPKVMDRVVNQLLKEAGFEAPKGK